MKKTACLKVALRFRRWSRARYAAFCSIGRVVTIGNLRKGIVEASLSKQHGEMLIDTPMQGEYARCIAYDESGGDDIDTENLSRQWWLAVVPMHLFSDACSKLCKSDKNISLSKAYQKRYISNLICLFFMCYNYVG